MSSAAERNERTVRGLFADVVESQQYDRVAEYCDPEVVMHRPGDVVVEGRDAYAEHYRTLHDALPDLSASLTDLVADGDRVGTRFVVTATHEGAILGLAPTGREVRFAAQVLFRLADGAVTEEFHQSDLDHLREQLRGDRPTG